MNDCAVIEAAVYIYSHGHTPMDILPWVYSHGHTRMGVVLYTRTHRCLHWAG